MDAEEGVLDALHVVASEEPTQFVGEAGGIGAETPKFVEAGFEGCGAVEFGGEGETSGEIAREDDGCGREVGLGEVCPIGGIGEWAGGVGRRSGKGIREVGRRERDAEVEAGADAAFGLELEGATEELDLALGDGEAEAGAALVGVSGALVEGFEDVGLFGLGDSEAGIEHFQEPVVLGGLHGA